MLHVIVCILPIEKAPGVFKGSVVAFHPQTEKVHVLLCTYVRIGKRCLAEKDSNFVSLASKLLQQ